MSRMFLVPGSRTPMRTWNVFVGCEHNCTYCNARKLALTRLKNSPRYKNGFKPHLVEEELRRRFKPGEFVLVAYMGDISFASAEEVSIILSHIVKFPQTDFLLCSKDPSCFSRWKLPIPKNVVLGTTIETNRNHQLSKAPSPLQRALDLKHISHSRKMVSIEPIMDFDFIAFTGLIKRINPDIVEVGADNYHNHLPEPSPEKLEHLLRYLNDICPCVILKVGALWQIRHIRREP